MIKALAALTAEARKDKNVLAVVIFGSFARKEKKPADVDVCIVLNARKQKPLEMSKIRLKYLAGFPSLDIQIFQQLPLYIKARVFGEGKVIFCRNLDLLYDLAASTAREFEDYKHIYKSYLEEVLHAR